MSYFDKRNKFMCPKCGHRFEIKSLLKWINAPHLFDTWRYLKCPECSKRSLMHIVTDEDDYVKVVRCEHCKYSRDIEDPYRNKTIYYCDAYDHQVQPDGFCYSGDRGDE